MEHQDPESLFSFQTLDAARAKQQLMQYFDEAEMLTASPHQFLMREKHFVVGKMNLYQLEFVGGIEFRRIANKTDFILHLILSEYIEVLQDKQWRRFDAPTAFMLSPGQKPDFRFRNGGLMLLVQINQATMQQHGRLLFPMSSNQPLAFPATGFSPEGVQDLADTLELLFEQYQHKRPGALRNTWQQQVDQFVLSQILINIDNNYREFASQPVDQQLPTALRQARLLMQNSLDKPFDSGRLCKESGLSQRSLQYQFNKYFGCAPRDYFLGLKLDALHQDLLRAGRDQSVTELALKWGFNHNGRLAQQYQRRFGELPSKTLQR